MIVVGMGSVAGLLGALLSMRLLTSQLFGVSPTDPVSLTAACVLLVAVGLVAAYFPARYATRIDPLPFRLIPETLGGLRYPYWSSDRSNMTHRPVMEVA